MREALNTPCEVLPPTKTILKTQSANDFSKDTENNFCQKTIIHLG